MVITRHVVAEQIGAHLRHEISLAQLVDWAENALLDAELDATDAPQLAQIVGRLGVADVRAFGLAWDDCESLLHALGYDARVEILPA